MPTGRQQNQVIYDQTPAMKVHSVISNPPQHSDDALEGFFFYLHGERDIMVKKIINDKGQNDARKK